MKNPGMVVLFGGTFDPIHEGHIHLAREVLAHYPEGSPSPIEKIYFVPAQKNPLKEKEPRALALHRLAMTRLGVAELHDPRVDVLDWELRNPGPSYSILTIEALAKVTSSPLTFLMGNEVFARLPDWHRASEIPLRVNLIVATRDSVTPPEPDTVLARLGLGKIERDRGNARRYWHSERAHWLDFISIRALPVSSTELRRSLSGAARDGDPPRGIQRVVWQYIKENGLYAVMNREA